MASPSKPLVDTLSNWGINAEDDVLDFLREGDSLVGLDL